MSKTIKDVFKIWWEDDRKYATPEQAAMQLEYDIKQAIREAILMEVIGEDLPIPAPFYGSDPIVRVDATNKLRQQQRQRLNAWMGLEKNNE